MLQPLVGGPERDHGRRHQEDQGGPTPHEHHGAAARGAGGEAVNHSTWFLKYDLTPFRLTITKNLNS
jgi:hypothetical protein